MAKRKALASKTNLAILIGLIIGYLAQRTRAFFLPEPADPVSIGFFVTTQNQIMILLGFLAITVVGLITKRKVIWMFGLGATVGAFISSTLESGVLAPTVT